MTYGQSIASRQMSRNTWLHNCIINLHSSHWRCSNALHNVMYSTPAVIDYASIQPEKDTAPNLSFSVPESKIHYSSMVGHPLLTNIILRGISYLTMSDLTVDLSAEAMEEQQLTLSLAKIHEMYIQVRYPKAPIIHQTLIS